MASYIKAVEQWLEQTNIRLGYVKEGTPLHDELSRNKKMYEELLEQMRKCHEPKQESLIAHEREPGEEG